MTLKKPDHDPDMFEPDELQVRGAKSDEVGVGQPKTEAPGSEEEIDLSSIRLSQNFSEQANVKKVLTTVPVRKPLRQSFVRVRPGEDWRLPVAVIELKEQRETYLVDRKLWEGLGGEISPRMLFTTIDRQGVVFLWPVRMPSSDGRSDHWNQSAMEAADRASQNWISLRANLSLGAYEIFEAQGQIPEPEWPETPLLGLINIAFRGRVIKSWEHPVLRQLRGEV